MINNRIVWVDQLKTIAIFFVVWGHLDCGTDIKTNLIYSFHMPLFIMISGFLFKAHNVSIYALIKENFKSLGIPYIVFGGFILIIKSLLSGKLYLVFILNYLTGDLFWFFPCLFVLRVLMNYIYIKKNAKLNVLILLSYLFVEPWLSMHSGGLSKLHFSYITDAIFQAPFFMIGYILKKHLRNVQPNIVIGLPSLLIFVAIVFYGKFIPSQIVYSYQDLSIKLLYAILGVVSWFNLTTLINWLPYKYIIVFSEGTAFVYPIHICFVYLYSIIQSTIYSNFFVTFMISILILIVFYKPTKYMLENHYKIVGRKKKLISF